MFSLLERKREGCSTGWDPIVFFDFLMEGHRERRQTCSKGSSYLGMGAVRHWNRFHREDVGSPSLETSILN